MPKTYGISIRPVYANEGDFNSRAIRFRVAFEDALGAEHGDFYLVIALDGSRVYVEESAAGAPEIVLASPVPPEMQSLTPSQKSTANLQAYIDAVDASGALDLRYPASPSP